jgi:phage terminase large subunit-like protein
MLQSSVLESLTRLPISEREAILSSLSKEQADSLQYDWSFYARPNQILPPGEWLTWLLLAGRGFGKTRAAAEAVRQLVCGSSPNIGTEYGHIAIVAETAADARDVCVEGESGILSVHPKDFRPLYEPSKRRLTWPNGARATLFNATEPDQLRGPQHSLAWCDELAKWQYAEATWDQLQFGMRLGQHPRQIVATTPRPIPVLKRILSDQSTVLTRGATPENKANLAPSFFTQVIKRYHGTRLGRQELNAEILDDVPGALWTRDTIDLARRKVELPGMQRVVVAVDPSGARSMDDEAADAIGIVVAALGTDGRGYILADRSCKLSPAGWARTAVSAYHEFKADRLIAERNFGGALVEHTIRTADPNISYREVTASRGKIARAEPVSALYEQGRVSHLGDLTALEDQMCQMTSEGFLGEGSPDACDALVWALSDLMVTIYAPQLVFA